MSALTDELLEKYSVNEAANDLIKVDPNARRLLIPHNEMIIGVRGDDSAESKYFALPRDLSPVFAINEETIIYVVWHAEQDDSTVFEGSSICEERSFNEDSCVFEWVVPSSICEHAGEILFNIHLHNETSKWHSAVASCAVLEGNVFIDHSADMDEEQKEIVDEYLEAILDRIRSYQVSHIVVVNDESLINEHTRLFVDTEHMEEYEFLTVDDRRQMAESLIPALGVMTAAQLENFKRIWGIPDVGDNN